jgi:hypothetical protein
VLLIIRLVAVDAVRIVAIAAEKMRFRLVRRCRRVTVLGSLVVAALRSIRVERVIILRLFFFMLENYYVDRVVCVVSCYLLFVDIL